MTKCRLSPVALGLSLGVIWGISILAIGLIACYYSFGTPFVAAMGSMYVGYEASIRGSVMGGIIGFIDAFICGFIVAWLYNVFAGCSSKNGVSCH